MSYAVLKKTLFDDLYRSITAVHYCQLQANRWGRWELAAQIVSGLIILVGLAFTAWPWVKLVLPKITRDEIEKADEIKSRGLTRSLIAALCVAAGSLSLLFVPFGRWAAHYEALVDDWGELRNTIERTEKDAKALDKKKPVPDFFVSQVSAIGERRNTLTASDTGNTCEKFLKTAQGEALRHFYGVTDPKEAEANYVRQHGLGIPVERPILPDKAPKKDQPPKKTGTPAGQSVLPGEHPEASIARDR